MEINLRYQRQSVRYVKTVPSRPVVIIRNLIYRRISVCRRSFIGKRSEMALFIVAGKFYFRSFRGGLGFTAAESCDEIAMMFTANKI